MVRVVSIRVLPLVPTRMATIWLPVPVSVPTATLPVMSAPAGRVTVPRERAVPVAESTKPGCRATLPVWVCPAVTWIGEAWHLLLPIPLALTELRTAVPWGCRVLFLRLR